MASNKVGDSVFRSAFMGYHKADVDDYLARMESELEIQESRKDKLEKQIAELNAQLESLNRIIDAERLEKENQFQINKKCGMDIAELEDRLQEEKQARIRVQKEYREFKESVDHAGLNPKTIQDAIVNAQRMSEMVIAEAKEKAEEILSQAEENRQTLEENGRQIIEDAKEEAQRTIDHASEKCESLQRDYDRILMDVTGFKAEMLKMYRKHMTLLASLPEKKYSENVQREEYIEGEYKDIKENKS